MPAWTCQPRPNELGLPFKLSRIPNGKPLTQFCSIVLHWRSKLPIQMPLQAPFQTPFQTPFQMNGQPQTNKIKRGHSPNCQRSFLLRLTRCCHHDQRRLAILSTIGKLSTVAIAENGKISNSCYRPIWVKFRWQRLGNISWRNLMFWLALMNASRWISSKEYP